MKVFAISDPHLSFAPPQKTMDRFGPEWVQHPRKIKHHWEQTVSPEDVVVVPGDISWAKKWPQALVDLNWLHELPGTKIILRGNHDLWWPSKKVLEAELPGTILAVQNNHFRVGPFVFFGARLWDTEAYHCNDIIEWDLEKGSLPEKKSDQELEKQEKIYRRELERLKLSMESIDSRPGDRPIGLCHYPPLPPDFSPTHATSMYEHAGAEHVIFGHLHSIKEGFRFSGTLNKVTYHLTSCDYLDFAPKLICSD